MQKLFLILAVATLALAACGGDSEDSGASEDFITQADEICTETQRELVGIAGELGPVTDEEDATARLEQFMPVREEGLTDLEALEPPEDIAAEFDEFVSLRREQLDALQEELEQRKKGDTAAAEQAVAEARAVQEEAVAAGESAGLKACAAVLPAEDADEVEDTITTLETSDDPALCEQTMTQAGVEALFGSLEECERTQETLKPQELADSVSFEEVTGVEGVTASAVGTVQGGNLDGDRVQYELIYEDGTYKVNAIFEAPPATEEASSEGTSDETSGYTDEVKATYIQNCSDVAGGPTAAQCECEIEYLAANLPYEDFKLPTKALDPALKAAKQECGSA